MEKYGEVWRGKVGNIAGGSGTPGHPVESREAEAVVGGVVTLMLCFVRMASSVTGEILPTGGGSRLVEETGGGPCMPKMAGTVAETWCGVVYSVARTTRWPEMACIMTRNFVWKSAFACGRASQRVTCQWFVRCAMPASFTPCTMQGLSAYRDNKERAADGSLKLIDGDRLSG